MVVAMGLGAVLIFFAGDPILAWRHDLKWHLITGEGSWLKMGLAWAVPGFGVPVALWILKRRWKAPNGTWLMAWALGYGLGLGALQASGGYQTGYSYGLTGMPEVVKVLEGKRPIATHDVIYAMKGRFVDEEIYDRPLEILGRLKRGEADALTLSPAVNTLGQISAILGCAELAGHLKMHFNQMRVGSYWVWIRPDRFPHSRE